MLDRTVHRTSYYDTSTDLYDTLEAPGSHRVEVNNLVPPSPAYAYRGPVARRSRSFTIMSRMMPQPPNLQPGTVAEVHSLKSVAGKKLNGKKCLVVRFDPDAGRWECCIEQEFAGTSAVSSRLPRRHETRSHSQQHALVDG